MSTAYSAWGGRERETRDGSKLTGYCGSTSSILVRPTELDKIKNFHHYLRYCTVASLWLARPAA